MMKNLYLLWHFIIFSIIACFVTEFSFSHPLIGPTGVFSNRILMMGAIHYPHTIEKIPMLRGYCCGNRIKFEAQEYELAFSISGQRYQSNFYLLITEIIDFVTEERVILYLKVPTGALYKLYTLNRVKTEASKDSLESGSVLRPEAQKNIYRWDIKENISLPENGRIPDNAIIICTAPDHIAGLEGELAGSEEAAAFELPKIVIREDLLDVIGSESELHEFSNRLLLSSLDYDAIHAVLPQEINHKAKTIVALTT